MKILYDGHVYRMQPIGGINRYLINIVNRLPDDWTPVITIGNTKQLEYRQLRFPVHQNLVLKRSPTPRLCPKKLLAWTSRRFFAGIESAGDFSLIHSVHHVSLASPRHVRRRAPFVVTVHDMIPQIFGQEMDPEGNDTEIKRRSVESADAVICVSNNTRKDLLEHIRISEDRVFVTHLASELSRGISFGDEPVPDHPYFLFVGMRKSAHKNFARLLKAFSLVAEKWAELCLCVAGPAFDPSESKLIAELRIDDRVSNINSVTDAHLAKLYRCSLALVCPSLYEGFGFPPLEAMACGSLAVVSNTSSLPEVAGESAFKVSPYSVESIADGMSRVLNLGTDQRREVIVDGLAWASRFDWNKTVKATISVYESLAS